MIPEFFQPYFTLAVIFCLFLVLYKELLRPSLGFMLTVLIFIVTDILTASQALSGFSNESIACIILLIVISAGLRKNFNVELFFDKIINAGRKHNSRNNPLGYRGFLLRMMSQVALVSSIVNNTPVVALMTPYVFNWGKKNNISPAKLLIPLAYAAILGGMLTLIGTSTTLVLNGFMENHGAPSIPAEKLLIIGGSVCLTGILMITLFGHRLLPEKKDILENFKQHQREYLVETTLTKNSPIINKTVKEAGLRNLKGVYLVEIIRNDKVISPVEPSEIIQENDNLIFAGNTEDIVELVKSGMGVVLPAHVHNDGNTKVNVVEAVISNNSSLIGKTVRSSNFRNRYDAAIVAIHRNGERLSGKIGDIKISQGDLLLLYAGEDFYNRVDIYRDLFVVSKIRELINPGKKRVIPLLTVGITAIALLVLGYFSLFTSLMIIFAIMAGVGMISMQDIKRELDFNMISILVFSLAIGQAIIQTGAGDIMANWVLNSLQNHGTIAITAGILLLTTTLTSFVTNVGAISITFPMAYSLSTNMDMPGMPLYLAIAYAASAAFLTPIGYQVNLIVYGPGGYTFKDFFKIGLPITIVYLLTVLAALILLYPDIMLGKN